MACKIWDVDNEKYSYYSRKEILEFLQNKQDLIKTYFSYGYLPAVPRDGMFAVTTSDQSFWYSKDKSWNKIAGGSGSSGSEVDPIYTADKPLLARKTDLVNLQTKTDNRLNSIVADGNLVSAILDIDANAKFLNDFIQTIDNLLAQSLAELQDKDEELQVSINNEATVRSAADTIQLNKINANTSQISANTTSITTNKNLQDLVNTQYLNKITALENKTGKLIVTKNTGETDAQALARVITAPVDGMAAFVYDPNAHGNSNNLTEYLRINGTWIEQGTHTATVDLTAYYTKTESDAKFIDIVELENLFDYYFDWLGAKTFTVGDRLPDATAQPTTGVLADVGKITTWENQDWMLFEINQAGILTYTWLPVAQGGSLSKGDTLHRDSVVEYFTTPDALKNIKILAGDLDTINYTFAEGVSGNLEVAPNASGNISIGQFNLNNIDAAVKANAAKNTQQDTAIAEKQPKIDPNLATASKDTTGSINEVNTKVTNLLAQYGVEYIRDSFPTMEDIIREYDPTLPENWTKIIQADNDDPNDPMEMSYGFVVDISKDPKVWVDIKDIDWGNSKQSVAVAIWRNSVELNRQFEEIKTKQPKTLVTPLTGYTATDVEGTLSELDSKKQNSLTATQLTNINSIGDKQNKAISLSGITATDVEGALVELAGKGGGTTFKHIVESANDVANSDTVKIGENVLGRITIGKNIQRTGISIGENSGGFMAIGQTASGNLQIRQGGTGSITIGQNAQGSQEYAKAAWNSLQSYDLIDFYFGKQLKTHYTTTDNTRFATSTDGINWTNTTNTADAMIKHLDSITGTSPASPIDIENQIFEDLETESKTLVGAMNEILHMVKTLQGK